MEDIKALYSDPDPTDTRARWNEVLALSRSYAYAEQADMYTGPGWANGDMARHFPDSLYDIPGLSGGNGNNSNTFARWLMTNMSAATAGRFKIENLDGLHPGYTLP